MPDRYWVGGSGTWDTTSTTNWSASSGGASGASAPTSVDNVFFDSNSNVGTGTFTVTVSNAVCNDFNAGTPTALDGAMTLLLSSTTLTVSGSWFNQATNLTVGGVSGTITFNSTTSGKTISTSNVPIAVPITFNGIGGAWTLTSNFSTNTASVSNSLTLTNGTFDTGGFSLTVADILSNNSNVRTLNLNNSTVTLFGNNGWNTTTTTNLTFNAGTSLIQFSEPLNTGVISSGGLTFYDVSFIGTAIYSNPRAITGNNTFRNLSFSGPGSAGITVTTLAGDQTITGTLTINGSSGNRRQFIRSTVLGTARTLNCAAMSTSDVDFRDITITGAAAPVSGTRLGDCGGNTSITFNAGKTVWWNLNAGGNWNTATAWALSEGGAVATANYPLPQDTVRLSNTGLNAAASIAFNGAGGPLVNIGSFDSSTRTNSMTFVSFFSTPNFYGDVNLGSGVAINLQSSDRFTFVGRTIRTLTTANITYGDAFATLSIQAPVGGGLRLLSNLLWNTGAGTQARILYLSGTLDLNNFSLTTAHFDSNNFATTRTLAFGTSGKIILSGTTTQMLTMSYDNLTVTGTSNFERALTSATTFNSTLGSNPTSSSQLLNINLISGSAVPTFLGWFGTINFTGSSCNPGAVGITSGGFILSTSGTYSSTSFTAGYTGSLTFNGKSINSLGVSGTTTTLNDSGVVLSALNVSSGILDLNNQSITCATFDSNNSNTRTLSFGTSGQITLTGNGTTIWTTNTLTNFTTTGTFRVISNYSGSTGTRTFILGTLNVDFKAGSAPGGISIGTVATDTVSVAGTIRDFDLQGFTGTLTNVSRNITGNFTINSGYTLQSGSFSTFFTGTSGIQLITTNGVTIVFPLQFTGVGGTYRLADNLTIDPTLSGNLGNGTLDLNNFDFSAGQFNSSASTARSINFGTSGRLILNHTTAATTVLNMSNAANFTFTGTSNVTSTMSVTRTFAFGTSGSGTATNRLNINLISGSSVPTFTTGSSFRQINFTGSTSNPGAQTISCHGFTLASGGTYTSTNFTIVGSGSLTFTGKSFPTLNIDATGSTTVLNDTGTVTTLTLTNGTLNLNGSTLSTSTASTASGTKNITFNNGTLTLTGSGSTVWNNSNPTGFSTTLGTGQGSISMTSASAKTFVGGGSVYNCTLNQGDAGTLTVTGNNTFTNITNSVQPCQITFTASTTTNCTRFTPAGTASNKVTITSSSATRANINVSTQVLYINCTISNINGDGAVHRAPPSLGNTNGGNNLDIIFANITSGNGTVVT